MARTTALANNTGSHNIAIGNNAGVNDTTGGNNIEIGNTGVAGQSNTIDIGTNGTQTSTFVAGVNGTPITNGSTVVVSSSGQLGVASQLLFLPQDAASPVAASSANAGAIYYDTTQHTIVYSNGSAWIAVGAASMG